MSGEAVKISAILNCNSGGDRASCSVVCIRDTLKNRKINVTCLGNIPFPYSQMPHKHLESEKKHNFYCSLLIIMYCTVSKCCDSILSLVESLFSIDCTSKKPKH